MRRAPKAFHNKASAAVAMFSLFFGAAALADGLQNKPLGLGLCLGEPAGVTAKYWLDERNALDAAVGYGFFPHKGVAVYADYLFNLHKPVRSGRVPFDLIFYAGVGGKLGYWNHKHDGEDDSGLGVGVRAPFGLSMLLSRSPFEIFLEITPSIIFGAPDPVWFDFDACLGARFYF